MVGRLELQSPSVVEFKMGSYPQQMREEIEQHNSFQFLDAWKFHPLSNPTSWELETKFPNNFI